MFLKTYKISHYVGKQREQSFFLSHIDTIEKTITYKRGNTTMPMNKNSHRHNHVRKELRCFSPSSCPKLA